MGPKSKKKLAEVISVWPQSGGNSGGGTKDDLSTAGESAFVRARERARYQIHSYAERARRRERGGGGRSIASTWSGPESREEEEERERERAWDLRSSH